MHAVVSANAVGPACENRGMAQDAGTVLRGLLYEPLISGTRKDITERFQALGLTEPDTAGSPTKAQRVESMLASLTVEGLRQAAAAVLTTLRVDASLRNAFQDVLWDGGDRHRGTHAPHSRRHARHRRSRRRQ